MTWTDEQVENRMGVLLRAGVVIAATMVLAGGVWFFAVHGAAPLDFRLYRGEPAALRGPGGVLRGVLGRDVRSAIQLGLLLLIATPVARVVFALIAFTMQKDTAYVVVSSIVLALLLYGLAGY
jgi:uncharacterized membrane protein